MSQQELRKCLQVIFKLNYLTFLVSTKKIIHLRFVGWWWICPLWWTIVTYHFWLCLSDNCNNILVCNHVTRRPNWGSKQHNFSRRIYMKIEFSCQRREMLLSLTTNMTALTSSANQQFVNLLLHWGCLAPRFIICNLFFFFVLRSQKGGWGPRRS